MTDVICFVRGCLFCFQILICNDQWTPALRPIRALAQVFVFRSKASPSRLVQRLKVILLTFCVVGVADSVDVVNFVDVVDFVDFIDNLNRFWFGPILLILILI